MIKHLLSAALLTAAFSVYSAPAKLVVESEKHINFPENVSASLRIENSSDNAKKAPRRIEWVEATDNWKEIGTGYYKDILFSDLFKKDPQTFEVTFEQNIDDPTVYRIPNLYQNMDFSGYDGYLTYDAAKATPMMIQVYDDYFAYFDEFDTGVYSTYKTASANYSGEVHMLMNGVDLLLYNDIETLAYFLPECLMQLKDGGTFTMEPSFLDDSGKSWSNILGLCYVTGSYNDTLFRGNTKGNFALTLPGATPFDPDADWEDIGNALYRDVFTEWIYESNPVYGEWEVPMQRSISNPDFYRLVNPYKYWTSPMPGLTYDNTRDYYLNLIIRDYGEFGLVGMPEFLTGLTLQGYGEFSVSNQSADIARSTDDYYSLYSSYPGCVGVLENGEISWSKYCLIDLEYYQNFYGWFGEFSYYGDFVSANGQGNFYIKMPSATEGIDNISVSDDAPVEYFNLQGLKVQSPAKGDLVIKRQGRQSKLIKF